MSEQIIRLMATLDQLFSEHEAQLAKATPETPEQIAARRAKSAAEWQRGIDLGWYDENGNPGPNAGPDEEEDED